MNKVEINCKKESNAKFFYASEKMFLESKIIKIATVFISIIPIVLSLIPMHGQQNLVFVATIISFAFTVAMELLSSFVVTHKERSVLLRQIYSAGITGCTFAKIEYDREQTNFLNELAIRKAEPIIASVKDFHVEHVPQEIDDRYAYLYICRTNAASNNYMMSRMFAFYITVLVLIFAWFLSFAFIKHESLEFLQLIIQFYPLVLPVIRNINACHKSRKYYTKISADIDSFFADKNRSPEKRARFISYIQGLEFEAMREIPEKYIIFSKLCSGGLKKLNRGVTNRFIDAIEVLEGKKITRINPVPLKKIKVKPNKQDDSAQTKTTQKQQKIEKQPNKPTLKSAKPKRK